MKCSIVMATKNKVDYLQKVLASIFRQKVPFSYEVIVVDDGSTDTTSEVCKNFDVQYIRLENSSYRNPSIARNVGYRAALGEIILAQSDEVIHHTEDTIERMCSELQKGEFVLATVYNHCMKTGKHLSVYTGKKNPRPFFFLGAIWRSDLYKVGGNDEEFVDPGYDDDWFADCLLKGLGLKVRFLENVIGLHQNHHRPQGLSSQILPSKHLYAEKVRLGKFESSGGPWVMAGFSPTDMPTDECKEAFAASKIDKTIAFFWSGGPMSWMRYLTLYSFRKLNPEWDMVLYRAESACDVPSWVGRNEQDFLRYAGRDYLSQVEDLGVTLETWDFETDDSKSWSPVRQSDIFQWQWLSTRSGIYADLDILFTKPLSSLPEGWDTSDVLWCRKDKHFPIGFLGSRGPTPFYSEVAKESLRVDDARIGGYQYAGLGAVMRTLVGKHVSGELVKGRVGWMKPKRLYNLKRDDLEKSLKEMYPKNVICCLEQSTVYPYGYKEIDRLLDSQLGERLPLSSVGVHWYAGDPVSQDWNCRLTEENFMDYPSLFTRIVEDLL